MRRFDDARSWFDRARFGLFIHWGLYAIHGLHEQEMQRWNVSRDTYAKLLSRFNPTAFDPEAWLDLAEAAGMSYLCFTTKHHDGFCLWDTKQTDFNIMNTPYGRDVLGLLAEACHRRNFPLCLYYSVVDWKHPNYPNQGRHHEIEPGNPGDRPHMEAYVEYVREQLRELCSNYGTLHGIWWDMNVPKHRDPSVNAMIRKLQPAAVINDRGFDDGDFSTPERHLPDDKAFLIPTEACQSVGMLSWGYREQEDFYSPRFLMESVDKILSMGGNYLLNVGPKADGSVEKKSADIAREIGKWYIPVQEAFADTEPATALTETPSVFLTRKADILYVHIPTPIGEAIMLPPLTARPQKATLLNTGTSVEAVVDAHVCPWNNSREVLRLRHLPLDIARDQVLVVKLEFEPGALPKM